MREHRFIRLAMPQASARQISAIRRVNHGRTFPVSKRAPPQIRDVGDQLIESRINEIDELQFEDRSTSVSGQPAGHPENGRFSQRRIENLFRKFGGKFLGEPKDAALWILNVLAENDAARIFLESETQSLVHGVADPIFARRQTLLVDL